MPDKNSPDDDLWRAIKSESIPAFEILVKRYWEAVYTTAFSHLRDKEMAMEIANDTFLNIWQKKHVLDIGTFKSYLTTSARYHVYKVLKAKKALKLAYVADHENLSSVNVSVNTGEEKIRHLNLQSEIEALLSALPARCREIFLLSRLGNLTNTEIAEKLSISKRTVENQISIAQRFVQQNSKNIALSILATFLLQ
ncbi:RNA polymerase sigma factor [Mucilaginibacter aquatilis]|uniref:Sigma-70 family RNA polymerase sigma factor n=1 Tax=Mucilaginibacter aquatilis TaxID=1517760 RepID=A0A6I4IDB3_9SPHI|nr:sigma-70 family RNA polymerase sigma factor [Mucilaginibacter aquatilis]MVN92977.1 sigma-70 family RNA polymerase sigma factor [Mucilaginibacter aquatilis]